MMLADECWNVAVAIKRVLAVIVGLFAVLGGCVAWHLIAAGWL